MILVKINRIMKGSILKRSFYQFNYKKQFKRKHLQTLPSSKDHEDVFSYIKYKCKTITITEDHFLAERLWIKDCIPIIRAHTDFMIKNHLIGDLFQFCFRIKINYNDIFSIIQNCLNSNHLKQLSFNQCIKMYIVLIDLKYSKDLNFLALIRDNVVDKIDKLQKIQSQDAQNYLKFIQYLIIDNYITKQQKQGILLKLTQNNKKNQQILQKIIKISSKKMSLLSSIFQQAKIYKVTMGQKFYQLFLDAYKNIDIYIKNNPNNANSLKTLSHNLSSQVKQKIFYQSVFEKMFENKMKEAGFNYINSPIIKGNQYDFLVTSRYKQKFCPLADFDITNPDKIHRKQWKPFPLQKLFQLNKCPQDQFLVKVVLFQQKVILNLNGPRHYIDSDMLPKYSICRKQQFKYQKLVLHNITRYSIINHAQWQEVDRYQQMARQFISRKINQPTILEKRKKLF